MRLIALFNSLSSGNIGLENFVNQSAEFAKEIIVLKQASSEANTQLSASYPDADVPIMSFSGLRFFGWMRTLVFLSGGRPAIMHAHHAAASLVAALVRFGARHRLMVTAHADFSSYKFRQKLAFLFSYLMADRIVCNSQATMRSLPWLIDRGKCVVIYNGVDFAKIDEHIDHDSGYSTRKHITIGAVSRMVPVKDHRTIVRAFAKATDIAGSSFSLCFVGDGPQRKCLEDLVAEYSLLSRVEFTGHISRDEVYRKLRAIDVFVVSSKREGFCNSMVEAAAAGKPIVATEIGTLLEVLGEGNGLFFPVGDSDQLCERLLVLLSDPALRSQLGEKGKLFVRRRYCLDASSARYADAYRELFRQVREL